jgi:hypothetical protein
VDAVTFDDSPFFFLVYFNYLTWYPQTHELNLHIKKQYIVYPKAVYRISHIVYRNKRFFTVH